MVNAVKHAALVTRPELVHVAMDLIVQETQRTQTNVIAKLVVRKIKYSP